MRTSISMVLSGEAGLGIKTVESLLIKAFSQAGYYLFSSSEVMSRVRGGNNSTEIRIAEGPVNAFCDQIDVLFLFNKNASSRLDSRISSATVIAGEQENIDLKYQQGKYSLLPVAVNSAAKEAGGVLYSNTVIFGVIASWFGLETALCQGILQRKFEKKSSEVIDHNAKAFDSGYKLGKESGISFPMAFSGKKNYINGSEAVGIGALAGGCNYIAAYPMSPATGVIQYLAGKAEDFNLLYEQAEDEIAAINMVQGAWYAGARAMTTTSGGGFALMSEGISLSGCTETPVVVHIGQRPGPATGLPTRTEQGDFNLALYSGHGDFPRVIYGPGTVEEAVKVTQRAFNVADQYQVPVFILTDAYLLSSYAAVDHRAFDQMENTYSIKESSTDYLRYKLTSNGISPRAIPGLGKGLVCVDSDEHDESGHITEDFETRVQMVDKRLMKQAVLESDLGGDFEPRVLGDSEYHTLIVGWGSTFGAVEEAFERLKPEGVAYAHFTQMVPLPRNTENILDGAQQLVLLENNVTGQFGDYLTAKTGYRFDQRILKYSGMPFSVEEMVELLKGVVGKNSQKNGENQ